MKRSSSLSRRTPLSGSAALRRSRLRPGPSARVDKTRTCIDCGGPISQAAKIGLCRQCSSIRNGKRAAEARRALRSPDPVKVCEHCGEQFVIPISDRLKRRRYCSQRCMGLAQRKPRICVVCGDAFWARWLYTKTCSRECANTIKTKHGNTAGQKAWANGLGSHCGACGHEARRAGIYGAHVHHVVYRQHVADVNGDQWDTRNAMTLCNACHRRQHDGTRRIAVDRLPRAAIAFAIELFGAERAGLYFARYYVPREAERKAA